MAIKRLNYDKLISGAVQNIIPASQYAAFSGYNALVGGAAFSQYDADIAAESTAANLRPSPVIPGLAQGILSGRISTAQAWKQVNEMRALTSFGIQYPGAARMTGSAMPTERTALGEPVPVGAFVSGPGIKKLSINELIAKGSLPYATVSSLSDVGPFGGTTGVRGLGVTQAARLTFTELQGVRDIEVASMLRDVPMISSPLTSYSRPGAIIANPLIRGTENIPQFRANYEAYTASLPGLAATAIASYRPGVTSGQMETLISGGKLIDTRSISNYAIQNVGGLGSGQTTGSFGLDVDAALATIPFQTQVNIATALVPTKVVGGIATGEPVRTVARETSPEFRQLVNLPMAPAYLPEAKAPPLAALNVTRLQELGPIKTETVPIPTLINTQTGKELNRQTNIGNITYAATKELAGQFQNNQLVYYYKDRNTGKAVRVGFDLFTPKPSLLPRSTQLPGITYGTYSGEMKVYPTKVGSLRNK